MSEAYNYKPQNLSKYLRLASKGDRALIRIASDPLIFWEEITDKDSGEVTAVERFAWTVIDKSDDAGNPRVRGYKASAAVFEKVKRLAENPRWGDPTTYDIEIERTEEPGAAYWSLTPTPPIGALTDHEKELLTVDGLDLMGLYSVDPGSVIMQASGATPTATREPVAVIDDPANPFDDE